MPRRLELERKWAHKPLLGIGLMLVGIAFYAFSDAFVKYLMGTYSVPQTTFLRALSRLIPLTILLFLQGGIRHVLWTDQKTRHAIRLVVNLAYTYAFMLSFSLNSLTVVYTISYTSSFFMVLLGTIFLKEKVTKEKWIAVGIGMMGVLIALRPGLDLFEKGALIILIGTALGALNKILMRKLTETENTLSIAIYPNLLMLLVAAPFLFKNWTAMPWKDVALFGVVGLLTAGGQYAVVQALRFAKASTLAPIDYSSFIWVISLDILYWGQIPSLFTFVGMTVIIGSNLYILYCTYKEEKEKNSIQEISTD
ncbi:MAG: DMT family transporter [Chlamydiota bacterium]